MSNTEKGFNKKAVTIYNRIIKSSKAEKFKAVYSWSGNLFVTNGYAIYMIKGFPSDFEFKSKVIHEDTLENMIRPYLTAYHTEFILPTVKELKAYIKEHEYSRAKGKISKAIYKLENDIYINAFYLLDALELCKSKSSELAQGYWSGEKIYIGKNKEYYVSAGAIEITSADGNNAALIMPIKARR